MKKNEKIIIFCYILTVFALLASSIYTFYQLKPSNESFLIEKFFNNSKDAFVK